MKDQAETIVEGIKKIGIRGLEGVSTNLSNKNCLYPPWILSTNIPISLGITLRRISDTNDLPPWQHPAQHFHPFSFVCFCTLRQRRKEPTQIHPGGFPEEDCAGRVVVADKGAEKRVEVVRARTEVEPGWVEEGEEMGVELGHGGYRGWREKKCCAEDTDWRGGECPLYSIVDVW